MNEIEPNQVRINEDSSRYRKDYGDIAGLAASIQNNGQLQPIVLTKDFELIAGGRRLVACKLLNIPVKYTIIDTLSTEEKKIIEIEENIARKNFTPAEEVLAVADLHAMYKSKAAMEKKAWTETDTAKQLGVSKMHISRELRAAKALERNPELKKATTKQQILHSGRGQDKLIDSVLSVVEKAKVTGNTLLRTDDIVFHCDGLQKLASLDDESVHLLLTDPPYGISQHNNTKTMSAGYKFDDSELHANTIYQTLATAAYKKVTSTGFAIIWVSATNFSSIREYFTDAGWLVMKAPLVWVKAQDGQGNNVHQWPILGYEVALFARKKDSIIQKVPMMSWRQVTPLTGAAKRHPTEKPLDVSRWIINHLGIKGAVMFDPFAGSFSGVHAALEFGMSAFGCDIAQEAIIVGKDRISTFLEKGE
jgi:ParB/RepB/Spo0J family partition protein